MSQPHRYTCLSAELHVGNITDCLTHFFGCIDISDRSRFLNDELHEVWLLDVQQHIDSGKSEDEARAASRAKREKWKNDCLSELRRIKFLRTRLGDDDEGKRLVSNLEDSSKGWKESQQFDKGIKKIVEWKSRPEYTSYLEESTRHWTTSDEYKKCTELAKKLRSRSVYTGTPELNNDLTEIDTKPEWNYYIPERDVNVPIMKFKGGEPCNFELRDIDNAKVWGSFPDQKTTVEHLLDETNGKNNILYREKADNTTIKYFHLHSNNMDVSAIPLTISSKSVADYSL